MFGYVLPARGEMKVRDFEAYRAVYCGVCKQLGASYGLVSRFLLNYDLVLVGIMADALSGEEGTVRCERCIANPFTRRPACRGTSGLELAADGLILLSWHKLCDNMADEGIAKRAGYSLLRPFLKRMYRKAAARRPLLAEQLAAEIERQRALERDGCREADAACEPTARMCSLLFGAAGGSDGERQILGRLGLFTGQIVYLLDAAEDFEDDAKKGRYNVFAMAGLTREETVEAVRRRCRMAAGEIALCYNLLNFSRHKDILDNIFFLGLPHGIALAGQKTKKRRPGHGEIDRV